MSIVAKTLAKAAVRTTYTAAGFLSIGIAAVLLYFLADLVVSPYVYLFSSLFHSVPLYIFLPILLPSSL